MAENRLFSAYVQTEIGRHQGGKGTGLGLSLVRQIVMLSGGRLGVTSKVGEGSTFWVECVFRSWHRTLGRLSLTCGFSQDAVLDRSSNSQHGSLGATSKSEYSSNIRQVYFEHKAHRLAELRHPFPSCAHEPTQRSNAVEHRRDRWCDGDGAGSLSLLAARFALHRVAFDLRAHGHLCQSSGSTKFQGDGVVSFSTSSRLDSSYTFPSYFSDRSNNNRCCRCARTPRLSLVNRTRETRFARSRVRRWSFARFGRRR